MKSRIMVACAVSALALFLLRSDTAATDGIISPGTTSAVHALKLLTRARLIYKMNSQSYTASNPTLDRFYMHKVVEVDRLLDRLRKERAISLKAIDDALDSEEARRLGGHPMPISEAQSF